MPLDKSKYPFEHARTGQRRAALFTLYAYELNSQDLPICLELCANMNIEAELSKILRTDFSEYALSLALGVESFKTEIDTLLERYSENWKLSRMPVIDLLILRLALFEIMHVEKVPVSVSIDEAVEIAKDFGGEEDSHKFINGLLGKIVRKEEDCICYEQQN